MYIHYQCTMLFRSVMRYLVAHKVTITLNDGSLYLKLAKYTISPSHQLLLQQIEKGMWSTKFKIGLYTHNELCLLYTSDAADE